eukprot:CAMPEP_0182813290 /NCGR_PEP_ID=MMETSP0006_2-20121128/9254_1 /TAXON_ID=97485 /ORGANISM="Prymnesium parvum, Strain Texoma1" /LENGTH=143 /DNA_ID=CAMNT_0024939363 /DNA_START=310 /DNA_END=741 /DNA_ORIENTATION=-
MNVTEGEDELLSLLALLCLQGSLALALRSEKSLHRGRWRSPLFLLRRTGLVLIDVLGAVTRSFAICGGYSTPFFLEERYQVPTRESSSCRLSFGSTAGAWGANVAATGRWSEGHVSEGRPAADDSGSASSVCQCEESSSVRGV